jgi:hypothetical protein
MQATKYTPVGNHGADPAPQHETDDAIDDRIAEILDKLLDERHAKLPYRRLPYALSALGLVLALIASILLRRSELAIGTIWPSTAAICLAATWTAQMRRS